MKWDDQLNDQILSYTDKRKEEKYKWTSSEIEHSRLVESQHPFKKKMRRAGVKHTCSVWASTQVQFLPPTWWLTPSETLSLEHTAPSLTSVGTGATVVPRCACIHINYESTKRRRAIEGYPEQLHTLTLGKCKTIQLTQHGDLNKGAQETGCL